MPISSLVVDNRLQKFGTTRIARERPTSILFDRLIERASNNVGELKPRVLGVVEDENFIVVDDWPRDLPIV